MLLYASGVFWPCEPEESREKYLQPQLGLFETATTLGHIVEEGDLRREQLRNRIFFENAYSHWQEAIGEPQRPRPAPEPIEMPNTLQEHPHGQKRVRLAPARGHSHRANSRVEGLGQKSAQSERRSTS